MSHPRARDARRAAARAASKQRDQAAELKAKRDHSKFVNPQLINADAKSVGE